MHPLPPPPPNRAISSSRDHSANANNNTGNTDSARPPIHPSPQQPRAGGATPQARSEPVVPQSAATGASSKKRRHRGGGKKKKNRRQSFVAVSDVGSHDVESEREAGRLGEVQEGRRGEGSEEEEDGEDHGGIGGRRGTGGAGSPVQRRRRGGGGGAGDFYARRGGGGNLSDESINSEALLDHRDQPSMRPRRDSRLLPSLLGALGGVGIGGGGSGGGRSPGGASEGKRRRLKSRESVTGRSYDSSGDEDGEDATDRTPLIDSGQGKSAGDDGYGARPKSKGSDASSINKKGRRRGNTFSAPMGQSYIPQGMQYDVNNPPSRPASPGVAEGQPDVMFSNGDFLPRSLESRRTQPFGAESRDLLINIDDDLERDQDAHSAPPSPRLRPDGLQRHRTVPLSAEGDVCFPADEISELGEDEMQRMQSNASRPRRRRRREWPQLWALDEWSREEKEARDGERRVKKINEPVMVGGRLRPRNSMWHRQEEDAPYRYTYFNEEFESTIHAQTISELVQPGGNFRELFIPDPPEIVSSSESSDSEEEPIPVTSPKQTATENGAGLSTLLTEPLKMSSKDSSGKNSAGTATPVKNSHTPPPKQGKPKRYGPRPTFWLDVLSPTDQEMRVLCKTFGIHALTAEDIMMQEAREKVELFRNYYFINYRTFEQDPNSEDYLEPVNMYVCVFRYGIVTFHFSQIPHPANVRRRIRQLTDYLILSADWISYAIIDDITDVYQPLITSIEEEVDDIDELILDALQSTNELAGDNAGFPPSLSGPGKDRGKRPSIASPDDTNEPGKPSSGIDVLRRIGECRKKTTSLYRLLGQKADVIKGFAKRCNEQWEVAPRSEIGLYLGDIQDHIITMSSNLSHYETSLSRAHSNYLAQVNIRMGERQESTADILGKLTVIGTIVLPMNVICGMWGMNVMVPGQEVENLYWFWGITAFMGVFAVACFYWCKKVYKIV